VREKLLSRRRRRDAQTLREAAARRARFIELLQGSDRVSAGEMLWDEVARSRRIREAIQAAYKRVVAVLVAGSILMAALAAYDVHQQAVDKSQTETNARNTHALAAEARARVRAEHEARLHAIEITCAEADQHHEEVRATFLRLYHHTRRARSTPSEVHTQQQLLNVFIAAVAPRYDCATRLRELTAR
jgi:hypothetical protein